MSDEIGRGGGLESSVDTGGVDPGEAAGGAVWGQGGAGSGTHVAGQRGDMLDEEQMERQRDEVVETARDMGAGRPVYDSLEDVYRAQAEEQARMDAEDEAWEEYVAEQERLEAEKDAAREEAHANEQAFLEEEYESGGETYQVYSLPDGTVITVNEDMEAVSVQWPEGEGPEYIGVVYVGGEPHTVWRLPTGEDIVVDADNNTLGTLDEVDLDETTVDKFILTGDPEDIGTNVTVEIVPGDDYSTQVVDAESGEVYDTWEAPDDVLGGEIALASADDGDIGVEMSQTYSLYNPPGTDYYVVIDENGVPVDTIPVPEEPEWSILGVVEYYEGGEIVVDLGAAEVSVDVVGPDGGITVDLDMLIVEGTAGIEWNEDGSWNFDVDVEIDTGAADLGVDMGFGQDADGMAYFDLETSVSMQIGIAKFEGGQNFNYQQTPEGSEWNVGMHGSMSAFGAYIERDQQLTVVFDDDGMTSTYEDSVEAGIKGLGGFKVTNETQFQTDGTLGGTSASQGGYASIVDGDGDDVVGGGAGYDTDDGWYTRSERIDTGADYERQYGSDLPEGLDTSDAAAMGAASVDRYGLGEDAAEDSDDGTDDRTDEEGAGGRRMRDDVDRVGAAGQRGAMGPASGGQDDDPEWGSDRPRRGADDGEAPGPGADGRVRFAGEEGSTLRSPADRDGLFSTHGMGNEFDGPPEGEKLGNFEIQDVVAGGPDGDGVFLESWVNNATDGPPEGAQTASNPPPPAEEEAKPPRPVLEPTRDGEEPEPEPEPKPQDQWPKIETERGDPKPKDDGPVDDGPKVDGPKIPVPPLAKERFQDIDADGDGVPDGRDPYDPIGSDDETLADVVAGGPPVGSTVSAGADQSSGTIDRPDDSGQLSSDASTMESGRRGFIGETEKNLAGDTRPDQVAADDITSMPVVMSGGTTMATGGDVGDGVTPADEPYVVEEPIPMRDTERGQLPDDYAAGKRQRPGPEGDRQRELVDDIAPVPDAARPVASAMPEPDHAPVEPEPAPAPEPVAEVETAIPAFQPEIEDEVVVAVAEPEPSPVLDVPEPPIDPDPVAFDDDQA